MPELLLGVKRIVKSPVKLGSRRKEREFYAIHWTEFNSPNTMVRHFRFNGTVSRLSIDKASTTDGRQLLSNKGAL